MRKRGLWAYEWLGVDFRDTACRLSCFRRPTSYFYSAIYRVTVSKYGCFEDFPKNWYVGKYELGSEISRHIPYASRVFSFGCGTGHVEKRLLECRSDICLFAYDFADYVGFWLSKISNLRLVDSPTMLRSIDCVLCVQVFYSLSDSESKHLVRDLRQIMTLTGSVLVVETSAIKTENEVGSLQKIAIKRFLVALCLPLYLTLFKNKRLQFWGWRRSNSEIVRFFVKEGFVVVEESLIQGQSLLKFRISE